MAKLLIFLGCISLIAFANCQGPMVEVEQGMIEGKTVPFQDDFIGIDENIDVFLGIPFAEPPLGERRFTAPIPKAPWTEGEVYDATYFRDICVQTSESFQLFTQSEDCLHLNVYAPNPKPSSVVPVMVWIHGGGYIEGNGYEGLYSGVPMASVGDVIVVTINYRLNLFGFLTTGDDAAPGNIGFLDQTEALRWINRNIEAFGGDPNKITIFGESAGAGSVSAHLFSPLSGDLFQQGILESGSVLASWSFSYNLDSEREKAFHIGEQVGCLTTDTEELLACMREVETQVLKEVAINYVFAPCVDGTFLTESPMVMLGNGDFKKCPLINGFNRDEGTLLLMFDPDVGVPNINSTTPPVVPREIYDRGVKYSVLAHLPTNDLMIDSVNQQYIDWSIVDDPEADYFDTYVPLAGDVFFSCPAVMEIRAHAMAAEFDIYQYYFTHVPSVSAFTNGVSGPKWLGAGHGEEIPFALGWPFDPPPHLETYTYPDEEKALSLKMIKYWSNFAKTSNPNMESMTSPPYNDDRAWPAFTIPELQYKELALELTTGNGLRADECHFWNDYLPQLTTFTADLIETEREWREEFYTWKYTDMEEWRHAFEKYQEVTNSN